MSVDAATVRRIAHLARIAVTEAEVPHLQGELNAMLAFVEQLSEVNVEGVEPMTSVTPMEMTWSMTARSPTTSSGTRRPRKTIFSWCRKSLNRSIQFRDGKSDVSALRR
jgi:aspartyl/glutamyl-tRNA(Asn/Gln) amidotransferase C subunit